jgi:hypothetical protein
MLQLQLFSGLLFVSISDTEETLRVLVLSSA